MSRHKTSYIIQITSAAQVVDCVKPLVALQRIINPSWTDYQASSCDGSGEVHRHCVVRSDDVSCQTGDFVLKSSTELTDPLKVFMSLERFFQFKVLLTIAIIPLSTPSGMFVIAMYIIETLL